MIRPTTDRHGQTSTEYLVILSVVIVLALIVVGVLGGFPSIGSGASRRASAAYWASADVAITSFSFDADGEDNSLTLRNNQRGGIIIRDIIIESTAVVAADTQLNAGGSHTFSGEEIGNHLDCGDSGDAFSYDVQINYSDSSTGVNYSFSGSGTSLEGVCAG